MNVTPHGLRWALLVGLAGALFQPGLGSAAARGDRSPKTDPLTGVTLAIDLPDSGTSGARVRRMWEQTRTLVVKDAAANLSDEQYHAKRDSVFLSWTHFQEQLYELRDPGVEKAKSVVPDVLSIIDDLYGFGGQPEPRIETRDTFKRAIDARLEKVDRAVKALP